MPLRVKGMIPEDDRRVAPVGEPAPPWMVNYADLMTELVCFFVILYALSAALNKDMQKAQSDIQEMIESGKMAGQVEIDKEGMRITLEEQSQVAFFQSGRSELTDQMRTQLEKINPILRKLSEKHDIVVEGHTDNIPIATRQFASNWELSTARATSVVKSMLADKFAPSRMSAVGYGEYHPIVPNDSEPNRKKNRRVVFFIKNTPYPDKKEPAGKEGVKPPEGGAPPVPETTPGLPDSQAPPAPEEPAEAGDAPAEAGEAPAEGGE